MFGRIVRDIGCKNCAINLYCLKLNGKKGRCHSVIKFVVINKIKIKEYNSCSLRDLGLEKLKERRF